MSEVKRASFVLVFVNNNSKMSDSVFHGYVTVLRGSSSRLLVFQRSPDALEKIDGFGEESFQNKVADW